MQYPAIITKEGKYTLAEFPDCPGCQTFAEPGEDIQKVAAEALSGWLETHFIVGDVPPLPSTKARRASRGGKVAWIDVPMSLTLRMFIRMARKLAGLSQKQLAERIGVTQSMIAKLESPKGRPTPDTADRILKATGFRLNQTLQPDRAHR